ncbi:MAG: sodium:solute symporter [Bacteroidota bacterium]
MSALFIMGLVVLGYFVLLIAISFATTRNSADTDFYTADRASKWYLVAFGMIGASLSGVTFISVPGEVANSNFYYYQVVLGYLLGYWVIAKVLLPLYYRLNLISIYTYLEQRFGFWSYKTGAFYFLLSRVIGASFRLFLVASVLQIAFFDALGLPFWISVLTTVALIWLYTFRGGIKTIIWTDTLQTAFMLIAVIVSILFIKEELSWGWDELSSSILSDPRSDIFNWDWKSGRNFFKQFFSGAFIAIVMTGLDQDMMQKNLTCRTLGEAQKNIFWFCIVLVIVNFLFLSLGVLLYQYAEIADISIPERSDSLFPFLAVNHFSIFGTVTFLLGITAAAYSSADSALTALTTSFCIDFLGFKPNNFFRNRSLRIKVHLAFSSLLFLVILIFQAINDQSVINAIFTAAGYTYGPLLGLFAFGIFTKWEVSDRFVPMVAVLSPLICFVVDRYSEELLNGYNFGFEILILNGGLMFLGLFFIRTAKT